jgi:periplasmic protein TonB
MHISLGLHLFGGKRRTAGTTMAPLTKDTLETTNSGTEASGSNPGASTKSEQAGRLRADAVSLEVPVKVHGSRVTDVVRGVTPHTEPFEEQTSTMIVFPQGAVIRMSTSVNVGQMLVVTNLKSRQDAICRVVKVRTFSNLQGYVEVEFTHKQPGYWNVYFPSEGQAIANKPAQSAAVEPAAPAIKKMPVPSASDISWAPAPSANAITEKPAEAASFSTAIKPPVAAPQIVSSPRAEPSFISIGRQEQVQPAASTITPAPPVIPHFEIPKRVPAPEKSDAPSAINFSQAPVAEAPSTISTPELHETVPAASTTEFQTSSGGSAERMESTASAADEGSRSSFGSLSGGGTLGVRGTSAPASEGVLDSYTEASAHSKTSSGQNWTLIAVCLFLVFGAVAGGVFYFRPGGNSAKPNSPALTQPAAAENLNEPQTPVGSAAAPQVSNPSRATTANTPPNAIVNGNAPAQSHDSPFSSNRPNTPAKPDAPHVTSDMMSATLKSHPVSSKRTVGGQDDAAPSLGATAEPPSSTTGALPGVIGSSDVASPPAPEIKLEGPVKIGGEVKEPRLLTSALPVYPAFARDAHVEGDVVIRTTIDKNGNVNHMEVVSGPTMLRQAALDALGRWKYVPSKLDGQAVSVQMLVTIRFHR